MNHHEPGPTCPLCEEKIKGGHPLIQSSWNSIKKNFPDAHISWCWRDEESQNRAFLDGLSEKRWPDSKHNHIEGGKPCSLALDLFKLDSEGEASFQPRLYYNINSFIEDNKLPLDWSGKWQTRNDTDHFQLKEAMRWLA